MLTLSKTLLFLILLACLSAFFIFDGSQYISLSYFTEQRQGIDHYVASHWQKSLGLFFILYIAVTALSLPGAAILTLCAGAIFGLWPGLLLASFASTIGATLAFLVSRLLFKDWLQQRFKKTFERINRGFQKEGNFYLFTLRLVPVFPFFLVNTLMGITHMKIKHFYWVSQLGMLAGTFVYVNAGTQLGKIQSGQDILSLELITAFSLLGVFPLLAKKLIDRFHSQKILRRFTKPKTFDQNLIVIGAGAGGLVSAYIAAMVKAKVTLIEKNKMGGDCLNTGCVPSKALLRSAKMASYAKRSEEFGIKNTDFEIDFSAVMQRVHNTIKKIEPHDSIERYSELGVTCITGEAHFISPWEIEVNGRTISAKNFIIATGGRPCIPIIRNLESVSYYTSDTIWQLREKPNRLLIIGGGPIACELSQAFQRLGVTVTLVQRNARLLPKEDNDVSDIMKETLISEGVTVLCSHATKEIQSRNNQSALICTIDNKEVYCEFDCLLIAVGRSANSHGFGLQQLGVKTGTNGTITVNDYMQSNVPTLYACGDVAGPYQFTHVAAHQAWYASVNSLFGLFKRFKVNYRIIPWCAFTDPEISRVGLNEQEAQQQGIAYDVTRYNMRELDRAITESETQGFIKVLTVPGKDKILGATIVGHHAGELITEFIQAMKFNLGLNKILSTIHIYPTFSEANKYTAGEWKKYRKPEKILKWLERFFNWQRN